MKDHYIRGIAGNKSIRFIIVDSTQLVERARLIHRTSPISTAALGRVLTATSMMGLLEKGNRQVSLQIKGSHLIRSIYATAGADGYVKGYISDPDIHLPAREDGKLNVGGAVGVDGELIVIRDYGMKEPYIGRSKLVNGEIALDLVHYYANSEQQPSAIALGVNLNEDGTVRAAGGLILQPLPEIEETELEVLEKAVASMKPMTQLLEGHRALPLVLDEVLKALPWVALEEGAVGFRCDCSRDRIEKALISMGREDLNHLIEEDGQAEVSCHFCNKHYAFTREQLQALITDGGEDSEESAE